MSLREAGKQRRRDSILDAAEALIRESGGIGFSMRDLAKRAGVAFVTPFNLFESKGGVLAALFEARLDAQRERLTTTGTDESDPIDRVLELAAYGSSAYTVDPELYRPLLRALPGVAPIADARLLELATDLWLLALQDAAGRGMIEPERDLRLLARTLHVSFRGALSLWAAHEVDADELERQAQYGAATCLLGVLTKGEHRERVRSRLRDLEGDGIGASRSRSS